MKIINMFTFVGAVLILGSPLTGHAGPSRKAKPEKSRQIAVQAPVVDGKHGLGFDSEGRPRELLFVSREEATGSHIPVVYRVYGNKIDTVQRSTVYDLGNIRRTGASDVRGVLRFDPAITFRGR